jgi:hypothetical protein
MISVTFKCNQSGNTVSFITEHDIASMRKHPDYTEVLDNDEVFSIEEQSFSEAEQPQSQEAPKVVARRGRPPKKIVEDTNTDSI